MELRKKSPSKALSKITWNIDVDQRDPEGRTLHLFDMKHRFGPQQTGDSKHTTRKFKTKELAWAAMWELVDEKLAAGYQWRDDDERKKYEALRDGLPTTRKQEPPAEKPSKPWRSARQPSWLTKLKDQVTVVERAIKKAKLDHRRADILSLARPAIRLKLARGVAKGVVTRFGGAPDVPANFVWPKYRATPLAFIAQFRCEELAKLDLERKLPAKGVISVFDVLLPENGYGEHAKVFYFADAKQLGRIEPSHDADADGRPSKGATATPSLKLTLPHPDSDAASALKLTDDEHSRYHDDVWLATNGVRDDPSQPGTHQLLGWPDQLAHDEAKWELLVQIDSDDRFGLELGDVETLRVFIATAKLSSGKFDKVVSAIGGE